MPYYTGGKSRRDERSQYHRVCLQISMLIRGYQHCHKDGIRNNEACPAHVDTLMLIFSG